MTRWAAQKRDVLAALAAEILHNSGRGRAVVGIDGDEHDLSALFASDLAEALGDAGHAVFVAHLTAFCRPRADRERQGGDLDPEGRAAAESAYREGYDYATLRRVLIDPFRLGGGTGFVLAAFDADRNVSIPPRWRSAPRDAVLLVAGEFVLRPELRGLWNASLRLDGGEPVHNAFYRAETDPRATATILVDGRDPDHPRRMFADSC